MCQAQDVVLWPPLQQAITMCSMHSQTPSLLISEQLMLITSSFCSAPVVYLRILQSATKAACCRLEIHLSMLDSAKSVLTARIASMQEEGLLALLEETFPYVCQLLNLSQFSTIIYIVTQVFSTLRLLPKCNDMDCQGIQFLHSTLLPYLT